MISLHYTSDRVTRFRCANTIIYIYMPGTQEIRGSSPGRGMTDFCTSIFICLYIYIYLKIVVGKLLRGLISFTAFKILYLNPNNTNATF